MRKIFISPKFWGVYSVVYFVSMIIACFIAHSHIEGGGGESDITVWAFQSHWSSFAGFSTVCMLYFLIIQVSPWLLAIKFTPNGGIYSKLLFLHFMLGLLPAIIYVGGAIYGLTADMDAHFDDWYGMGIYPSPIGKDTSVFLAYFWGPVMFLYGLFVSIIGMASTEK